MVDYVITSANYLSGESHFETSPHSDHCPLTFKLISIAGYIFSIQKIKPTGWQPTSGHTRKIEPQQDNPQPNDPDSKADDLGNPTLMKATEDNLVDAFSKHDFSRN